MRKKGLLVATIVMVLVLAVSLTTATYAWFSATASATVETIRLEATAADGLIIGALGTATAQASRTYTDYRYGDIVWDGSKWNGDSYMGTNLNFQIQNGENVDNMVIGASKAVSYTTTSISGTGDAVGTTIPANSWYKANGDAATLDTGSIAVANVQEDYIDFDLAVTTSKANSVKQAYMTLQIVPTATTQIKMAAAIHFYLAIYDGTTTTEITNTIANKGMSAYPGKVQSNNFGDNVTAGTYVSTNGTTLDTHHTTAAGDWYYIVPLFDSATAMTPFEDLIQIKLIVWIEGTDDACIIANAGTGADVKIFFDYDAAQTYQWSNGVMTLAA
jgi:hypothetical protein